MAAWEWLSETAKLSGTLITAAFGVFTGAYLASRASHKRELTAELRSIKAALGICFSMCNRFVGLKKQIIRPLYQEYQKAQQSHDRFLELARKDKGPGPLVYPFYADLQTVTPLKVPIELLERHVFEKIRTQGRALHAATDLIGAIDALEKHCSYRNDLILAFQTTKFNSDKEKAEKYLGRQTSEGITDQRFRSNIEALAAQVDDCIFFSRILAEDLETYGNQLWKQNAWKYRLGISEIIPADWSEAERQGLMPPRNQYEGWLKGFRRRETPDRLAVWMGKPTAGLMLLMLVALFASAVGLTWSFAYSTDPILLAFTLLYEMLVFGCLALLSVKVMQKEA